MESGKVFSISVYELLGQDSAVSSSDGEKLFSRIDQAFKEGLDVVVNFNNIEFTVSAFLNAGIGQLYNTYDSEYLKSHLSIENLKQDDLRILAKVIVRAKEYFANKDKMDQIIKNSLGDE